jgi:ANTAR domain-containing protein
MSKHSNTAGTGDPGRRRGERPAAEAAARPGGQEVAAPGLPGWPDGKRGKHAAPSRPSRYRDDQARPGEQAAASVPPGDAVRPARGAGPVARRTATGWRVGDEEVSDLTSAMVLADLLAAELPTQAIPALAAPAGAPLSDDPPDPRKLEQTVAQLEHALTARVRVEQAIGVLAERHRLRPRQAFELLRSVARAQGRRVLEMATDVVESATNPLLRIPEELAKPPMARRRGRRLGPDAG